MAKILAIAPVKSQTEAKISTESAKWLRLLINQLDPQDRRLWRRKLGLEAIRTNKDVFIVCDSKNAIALEDGKSYSFQKQPQIWNLLRQLRAMRGECDQSAAIAALWGKDVVSNPSYGHRLRNLVQRFNAIVEQNFGVSHAIRWNSANKSLGLSLKIQDEI